LGLLFSLLIHLLLLVLAVNVIIFSRYFPEAFTGLRPEQLVAKKTLPEYLFQPAQRSTVTPDWERPVEAESSSRVVPEEPRQLLPVEHSAPRMELPKPREQDEPLVQKHLMERKQPSESTPTPANSPTRLARRQSEAIPEQAFAATTPQAPDVPTEPERMQPNPEQSVVNPQRASLPATTRLSSPSPSKQALESSFSPATEPSLAGMRSSEQQLPTVGDSGIQSERVRRTVDRLQPAGSSPAPQSIAVARVDESANRMIAPAEVLWNRQGKSTSAQIAIGTSSEPGLPDSALSGAAASRSSDLDSARSGVPEVTAGVGRRSPGRTERVQLGSGFAPAGPVRFQPDAGLSPGQANLESNATLESKSSFDSIAPDRLQGQLPSERASQRTSSLAATNSSTSPPSIDVAADELAASLGERSLPLAESGIAMAKNDLPEIAALDLPRPTKTRRDIGGPVTPFGATIAAVDTYNRRVQRTQAGSLPSASGLVAPATEEAIERGLAYLKNVQNKDGSWSLQGHGSDVLLRSDTAATGLCLLAFQGAGYTHRQHQYAETVNRGLKFLLDHQRSNGDLYRSEDELSNRNVALYSHGIASLALCEAYGMTQDPELKDAAQNCLNYIIATQHRQRGGWRYTPQVSSDTSVSGWMMMALKSGQLSGLDVPAETYRGIEHWLGLAQSSDRPDRYRYNPFAPDTPTQRHGRVATPTMTAVGMLMRMYGGWRRDTPEMQSAADYLLQYPPQMGTAQLPQRDAYYWYYATQVMFHMGGRHWNQWNQYLNPLLLESQINRGPNSGSWDPIEPVADRWSPHAGRIYVTTMNLLNLEVYYRHLPIYEDVAQ
jgi:hypothetical protein